MKDPGAKNKDSYFGGFRPSKHRPLSIEPKKSLPLAAGKEDLSYRDEVLSFYSGGGNLDFLPYENKNSPHSKECKEYWEEGKDIMQFLRTSVPNYTTSDKGWS
jgi:hypothetical protein